MKKEDVPYVGQYDEPEDDDDYDYYDEECDSDCEYDIKKKKYLVEAIMTDNVSEFVLHLNSLFDLDNDFDDGSLDPKDRFTPESLLCPTFVTYWICFFGAVKCGTALLQGQTCVFVDLNVPFSDGNYPLYVSASGLDFNIVDLFLKHGARTDVTNINTMESNSRPLNAALEILNNHSYLYDWTPEESIYKLVIILCLPQMKLALETNRVLAMSTKDAMEVFINYAKEGKLIEMAVLLLVANERVMPSNTFQNKEGAIVEGGMSIHDMIMEDILSRGDEEREVSECNGEKRSKSDQMIKSNRAVVTLILLKILERTGDAIQSYLRSQRHQEPKEEVVKAIASILNEAGFVLKEKDIDLSNIDCESDWVRDCTGTSDTKYKSVIYRNMILTASSCKFFNDKRQKELVVKDVSSILKDTGFVLKDEDIELSSKVCESDEINEVARTSKSESEFSDVLGEAFGYNFFNAKLNPMGWPSNHEAYRGKVFNPTRSFSSSTHPLAGHCFKPLNSSVVCQFQKNQFKREKNAVQRHMPPSKSRNIIATLALSFKWGMRRI